MIEVTEVSKGKYDAISRVLRQSKDVVAWAAQGVDLDTLIQVLAPRVDDLSLEAGLEILKRNKKVYLTEGFREVRA